MSSRLRLVPAACVALLLSGPAGAQRAPRTELGFVPFAGGDTDIGFGVGALGSVAALAPGYRPYKLRLEGAAFVTFKAGDGGLSSPYQDAFLLLTIPQLAAGRLRLELRPAYTRETKLRYFGLGNAAPAPRREEVGRDFYARTHPGLILRARLNVGGGFFAVGGLNVGFNEIAFSPESNLARDLASDAPSVRSLLHVDRRHGLALLELGLAYDSRDDEIDTARGAHHHVKLRASLGGSEAFPYRYVQTNVTLRAYHPLLPSRRLVLAVRAVADAQAGDVPFYELSRFEEASALGGANGVRGVPGDRYLGKIKLFGNVEARWTAAHFDVAGSRYALGLVGFFDGGRLWADWRRDPTLDGRGLGLKYGTGLGLRVQKGETFVVRADLAWSPDARPVGGYFLAGHLF